MIISEKQVMKLMTIASEYTDLMANFYSQGRSDGHAWERCQAVCKFLRAIEDQQSEELKEVN